MSWDFGGSGSRPSSGSSGSWDTPPSTPPAPTRPSAGSWGGSSSGPTPGAGGRSVSAAPLPWLLAALGTALVAIGAHFVTGSHWVAVGSWLLAGPVSIALLAVFVRFDTERRAEPLYAESGAVSWGRRLAVLLALVGVALSAWTIADAIARSNW